MIGNCVVCLKDACADCVGQHLYGVAYADRTHESPTGAEGMSTTTQPAEEKALSKWELYEQRKAELPEDLSPSEYENECQKIAKELGI